MARGCYARTHASRGMSQKSRPRDSRLVLSPATPHAAQDGSRMHSPATWSHEESFIRTGVYCTVGLGTRADGGGAGIFQPSAMGGSHVVRCLRKYAADVTSYGTSKGQQCTKHKDARPSLIPGTVYGWCHDCQHCIFMAVMANAESPRCIFEILFSMFEEAPAVIIYDNCCNLMHYCLNREAAFFERTTFMVDHMHFTEHKKCCPDFDSAKYECITNSSMAEQKNSVLRQLEKSLTFMNQHTFLWFLRHWVHRMHART